MLAALQQNNQRLLQENHRMQLELLEAPKLSRFEMEDAEAEGGICGGQPFFLSL